MNFFSILILSMLCAAAGLTAAAPSVEYLIIGNPAVCELFDQYEQPLSPAAKRALPRNMPFEIIKARQTMGDQITEGMRLAHMGTVWYLILDENGMAAGLPAPAGAARYRGCTPQNDTLLAVNALRLGDRPTPATTGTPIAEGESLIRMFTYNNSAFYYRLGTKALFGWSQAPRSSFSIPAKKAPPAVADEYAGLHGRIMKRLTDANERYNSLFRFFGTITQKQKSVPRWVYSANGTSHCYRLTGSVETVNQFTGSNEYIVRDIDYMLLGKPFAASYRDGVITIGPRPAQ